MSRNKQTAKPPLEWPAWLVDLAAHDTPPAELTEELRCRLQSAGVDELFPADFAARKPLEPEEHERATGIGAAVDGHPCAEPLFDGPTRTADALGRLCDFVQRYDRLRTIRLAAIDMGFVHDAARALLDEEPAAARAFSRILETGIVVTYARPYLPSNRPPLGERLWPKGSEDRALHDKIVDDYRHGIHAHSHRTKRRTLLDTADLLGLEAPPTYAESWRGLTKDDLERLADLAERQEARLHEAADGVGAELGEARSEPSYPRTRPRIDYRWDSEVDDTDSAFQKLREALERPGDAGNT
jgi:hypothetical protein